MNTLTPDSWIVVLGSTGVKIKLSRFIDYYNITLWAAFIAFLAFFIGAIILANAAIPKRITNNPCGNKLPSTTKFFAIIAVCGLFSLAMYVFYQIMLQEGLDSDEFSIGLQIYLDALVALFASVCICRYDSRGIVISSILAAACFTVLLVLVYSGDLDLKYSDNSYNLGLLNTHILMLIADVSVGLAAVRTSTLVGLYKTQHDSSENTASKNFSKSNSESIVNQKPMLSFANNDEKTQDTTWIKDFLNELAAEKKAKEAQAKAKEPAAPKAENKYTIYSSDEVSLIAKRVLDDMPSDIFGIELLTLKQNMLKKFIAEKDDFKPGDDLRFYMYKAFYGHTYDLLLNDQCYFMGDFTQIGKAIYRLCTYCLDESHRLGYVDDDLYKAQKNNISINVRNGKSFS